MLLVRHIIVGVDGQSGLLNTGFSFLEEELTESSLSTDADPLDEA